MVVGALCIDIFIRLNNIVLCRNIEILIPLPCLFASAIPEERKEARGASLCRCYRVSPVVLKGGQSAHRHIWGMCDRKRHTTRLSRRSRACFDTLFIVYDVTVWGLHQINLSRFIVCNSNVVNADPLRLV